MLGNFISAALKVATLPVDAANAAKDLVIGGDGSKFSRTRDVDPLSLLEQLRDKVAESAEKIDE